MNYCTQRKIIFIHAPRTGGGTIEKMCNLSGGGDAKLGNYNNGHAMLRWYPPEMIDEYYIYATVRNPFARIFSLYKWVYDANWNNPDEMRNNHGLLGREMSPDNFQYWLESYLTKGRKRNIVDGHTWWRGIHSQVEYMVSDSQSNNYSRQHKIPNFNKDNLRVKDYIRLENFNEDVERIKSIRPDIFLNQMVKIHESTNKTKGYRQWYTATARQIVEYWNKDDIDYFKYEY